MTECNKSGRLSAYLDRELSPDDLAATERHLAQCPACAAALREFQSATAILHGSLPPALSPAAMARLHERVDEWNRRGAERFAGVLSGLAACLAIVSALSLMRTTQAAPAPLPWEAVAARITDDSTAAAGNEYTVAAMMVSDVSQGGAEGE